MSTFKKNEWFDPNAYRKIDWASIKRFVVLYAPLRRRLTIAVCVALVVSGLAFFIPSIFVRLTTALQNADLSLAALETCLFLAVLLGQTMLGMIIERQQAHVFTSLNRDLLLAYYEKMLRISVPEFLHFKQGTNLFQRVIDAMNITSTSTRVLVNGVKNLVNCLALIAILAMLSFEVVFVVATGCGLLVWLMCKKQPLLRMRRQKALGVGYPLVSKLLETLNCLITIKSLAASPKVTRDISELVERKRHAECDEHIYQANLNMAAAAIVNVTQIGSLGFCLYLFHLGQMPLAHVFAVYVLMGIMLSSIQGLAGLYMELAVISVNFKNYFEVMDLPDEQMQTLPGNVVPFSPLQGKVQFCNATFAYHAESRKVLDGINFNVKPGERIALIGKSGAGKTTLLRLMMDFLKLERGEILIDDQPIETFQNKNAFRNNFGIVNQHEFFFQISLRENLTFGMESPPDDALIIDTLAKVDLWQTIAKLPDKLDTIYAEHQFSGGEKQRLFIARALLRDPRIVLMDEPTSALDFESEQAVMKAMDVLLEGKTAFIIAHRLSTVRNADKLLVLQDGKIVAAGKHDELYEASSYYRGLCDYASYIAS